MKLSLKLTPLGFVLLPLLAASFSAGMNKIATLNKITDSALDNALIESLNSHIDNGPPPEWSTDCSYNNAYIKNEPAQMDVYVQASCSFDYHKNDDHGKPIIGGVGTVVHMQFQVQNKKFKLTKFEQPGDGSNYTRDMQRMFPKEYLATIHQ
jgi:hypothetical protein